MGDLVLHNEVRLGANPHEVFSMFGRGDPTSGWLFGAEASSLAPGSLVRLVVPLGGLAGVDGTARVLSFTPSKRIELVHESPWSGKVDCRFDPTVGGGTRVRLRVTIDEQEIGRLGAELGLIGVSPNDANAVPLGLLISLSGAAGILGRSTVNCAELAVEEVNLDGGVLGRPVQLVVADDATDPAVGRVAMQRLIDVPNVSAVIGMHSSATAAVTCKMAIAAGLPYLYTATSEITSEHPLLARFGETPLDQLHRALPRLAEGSGASRWFFAGNEYSWPRSIASTARTIVERMGGTVAGEGFVKVGARQFEPLLEQIHRSGADHVISSFVGEDHVRFEREFVAYGLRDRTVTFAPLMDDAVVEHLGDLADGIWNVLGYFQSLDTPENRAFLSRYRQRFGECSAPVSAAAEGVYEAVHRWARACRSGRGIDATAVLRGLQRTGVQGPRLSSPTGEAARLLLGRASPSGVQVMDELPARAASM